ncbi:DUF3284 domain-containing protein [Clostridium sp. LY3-2]|uniref:DUF3284 domain-containing protein n=1 Tax=Clostridium sp. LY3-2 TaxID=2942482 RepID=UPI0021522848|nr:DUF3284 domain-containing protein [Clostridium sp. LY3-2]MCR6515097.1 DUF3284 domain-containing protein [Clostridium sp. LY3-2]
MAFINSVELDYPVDEVFKVIIRTAKRDFANFNPKDPIGTYTTKTAGNYGMKQAKVRVEITDYKLNELYQITTVRDKLMFVSTYRFEDLGDSKTRFTLEESDCTEGFFKAMNGMIQNFVFKKRIKNRFSYLVQGLENEILTYREKVEKAKPKAVSE